MRLVTKTLHLAAPGATYAAYESKNVPALELELAQVSVKLDP